jgi:hypothetical protein
MPSSSYTTNIYLNQRLSQKHPPVVRFPSLSSGQNDSYPYTARFLPGEASVILRLYSRNGGLTQFLHSCWIPQPSTAKRCPRLCQSSYLQKKRAFSITVWFRPRPFHGHVPSTLYCLSQVIEAMVHVVRMVHIHEHSIDFPLCSRVVLVDRVQKHPREPSQLS